MTNKIKFIIITPVLIAVSLAAVKFISRYQSAVNNKREMLAMTQSLLRINRDEVQRNPLVRKKINELKEKREFVAASRGKGLMELLGLAVLEDYLL